MIKNKFKELLSELKQFEVQTILFLDNKKKNNCKIFHSSAKLIDLFLNSDSIVTIIAYHISLVKIQDNYCNNNLFILDVKHLNKIIKLYYSHALKALWDGQGKIKMYYWMPRVKK